MGLNKTRGSSSEKRERTSGDVISSNIPKALTEYKHWVCWEYDDRDNGKPGKEPVNPEDGISAKSSDSNTWADFKSAEVYHSAESTRNTDGIGFVFSDDDPFVGIDLDDCVQDGKLTDWARDIVDRLDSYTEFSPSGTGVHVIMKGDHPGGKKRTGNVEMYEDNRFFTVTGNAVEDTPATIEERQVALSDIHDEYLADESDEADQSPKLSNPSSRSGNGLSDDEVLQRAKNAANGVKFQRLWSGDTSQYDSQSEADLALCRLLAFWTGGDDAQIDRMFRKSRLMREKWRKEHYADGSTYGEKNIETALDSQSVFYDSGSESEGPSSAASETSLTLQQARNLCQHIIDTALIEGDHVLVDALPAMGKSSGVIRGAASTGTSVTIFAPRHDLYNEYEDWCEENDLHSIKLPSFHQDCPTARGDHGEHWQNKVLNLYNQGVMARDIHERGDQRFGEELPCHRDEHCEFIEKWSFNPDDFDVIVGHYLHAYKRDIRHDRVVVFDELPADSFVEEFDSSTVTKAISRYVNDADDLPFDDYTDLLEKRNDPKTRQAAHQWFAERDIDRDSLSVLSSQSDRTHALAPLMTYAILVADKLDNGWESASLGDISTSVTTPRAARCRKSGKLYIALPPTLSDTAGVVALDGTAVPELWRLVVDEQLEHRRVLNDDERTVYLDQCLDYTVVQTAQTTKPYSGGPSVTPEQDELLFDAIADREGTSPCLISSKTAIGMYEERQCLSSIHRTKHYGGFKGSNEFADVTVGIIAGSPHNGDGYVKRWGALKGRSIERSGNGLDLDYGSFGNAVLRSMRESRVFQALMRFGRNDSSTTVYVHTAVLPEYVPVTGSAETTLWTETDEEVIDALQKQSIGATTRELTKEVIVTNRQVRNVLNKLDDAGVASSEAHPQDGRKTLWTGEELNQLHPLGYVRFEPGFE